MTPKLSERLISVIAYFTFGIFSIIWIIFANVSQKKMSPFLIYNLYQAIFISIVLAFISFIYDIALNFMATIPFIGKFVVAFDLFINKTPMYFTFTITGLLITLLISYLSFICLIGKNPFIPIVSDIIKENFNRGDNF